MLTLIAAALVVSTGAVLADTHVTKGTVTKIDTKWEKVTIDHEELKNLGLGIALGKWLTLIAMRLFLRRRLRWFIYSVH